MGVRILIGDVRTCLADLPDDCFDCVVTSPPYWGLRDYGVQGQIGLEPTLGEHIAVMVEICREIRRVLKPTGTFWLNYGDCYATSPNGRSAADTKATGNDDRTFRDKPFSTVGPIYDPRGQVPDNKNRKARTGATDHMGNKASDHGGRIRAGGLLKPKDLCMVPNRLAIALQEDGWWVRSEIIWAKPNPMPESITDRPATSHEKIFLLTKSARYAYDADAVRQASAPASAQRWAQNVEAQEGSHRANGGAKTNGTMKAVGGPRRQDEVAAAAAAAGGSSGRRMAGFNARWDVKEKVRALSPRHEGHINHTGIEDTPRGEGRNLRNYEPAPVQVWNIATRPFSDAHFATFPPELAERCLLAGCPAGGKVLDPFGGAGTVGLVGDRMGLDCTLIELNPAYAEIARKRLAADAGLFSTVEILAREDGDEVPATEPNDESASLFAGAA